MADVEKRKKLEAARRKLKMYQQEKRNGKGKENEEDETHSVSSSSENQAPSVTNDECSAPQILTSYFAAAPDHAAANFFDVVAPAPPQNPESPLESLMQISSKINRIVPSDYEARDDGYTDMERRNVELASLYESEKLQHKELEAELSGYKERVVALEDEVKKIGDECEGRLRRELGPLQEQLQCHMQTVGILVGEKTELGAELSQCRLLLKRRTDECDDLSARLKTSRSRAAELERELLELRDASGAEYSEVVGLKTELATLQERHAEARQDLDELREKLKVVGAESQVKAQTIKELSSQLDMANVKLQQLTFVGSDREDGLVEQKHDLEKQLVELNLNLKNAIDERDQASSQYQQYVQQLNNNLSNLAAKLEATIVENEQLKKREHELIGHVGDLEKRLQTNQVTVPKDDTTNTSLTEVNAQLREVQQQYEVLREKFEDVIAERDELMREVEAKKENVAELEGVVERLEGSRADSSRLLAAIESDKVAASRAVQQNAQLKQQLEEMQEAFIKMTNDKADLMDQVTSERHRYKELEERTQQSEHLLQTLKEAVNIKDHELTEMRRNAQNSNGHRHDCDEAEDHHHHHHNHNHEDEEALQKVIFELREEVDRLKVERDVLQSKLHNYMSDGGKILHDGDKTHHDEGKTLHDGDKILYDGGKLPHEEDKILNDGDKIPRNGGKIPHDGGKASDLSNDHLCELNKELAMRQLEAKFMRTMQDIANLQDEKQMLEHLVLQLQGETETIGEYIALYQHQRGVLKQRSYEKETQLKQLAKDREDMKRQLGQLNALVRQLIAEKGSAHDAERIVPLLGEIESSNLVEPADVPESFHPCPWCSGQLITV